MTQPGLDGRRGFPGERGEQGPKGQQGQDGRRGLAGTTVSSFLLYILLAVFTYSYNQCIKTRVEKINIFCIMF